MMSNRYGSRRFGSDPCCGQSVQTPPEPCCEAHHTVYKTGVCFFVTCDVTASAGTFPLTFKDCAEAAALPLDYNQVFFWHQSAGLMQVESRNESGAFIVRLVDPQRVGAGIKSTECILVTVQPSGLAGSPGIQRCLSGNFVAPANNASGVMYILNGTAIPTGATVTIVWHGEVGSYVVTGYISAEGNIYAYTVTNTGSGLTPGTIVNGGDNGAGCAVPVEIISTVDICETSETQELDTFAGCFNGSPRSGKATGPNQIWVSGDDEDNVFGLRTTAEIQCCLTTNGCLKFTQVNGCNGNDTTTVANVGIDCVSAAWEAAVNGGTLVPVIINGFPFVITNWNEETKQVTLSPVGSTVFDEDAIVEFKEGTQICLGGCCNTCVTGHQTTLENAIDDDDAKKNANFNIIDPGTLPYVWNEPKSYLVGIKVDGTEGFLLLDDAYAATGNPLPKHADPLLIRQKICNDDPKGCNQKVTIDYNFGMIFDNLQAGYRVHWEVGSFIAESATLADGTTPNPNTYASSQAKVTGYFDGPNTQDEDVVAGTGLGFGGPTEPKKFPTPHNILRDYSLCKKCDCLNSILWFFIRIEPTADVVEGAGDLALAIAYRRIISKEPVTLVDLPQNLPTLESFAT